MQPYQDIGRDSGVSAYRLGQDSIAVQFKHGGTYLYTYASAGREAVETMKRLAVSGDGLATYINRHVGSNYATKLG